MYWIPQHFKGTNGGRRYITSHRIALHHITLHKITLHHITLHYVTLYIQMHSYKIV